MPNKYNVAKSVMKNAQNNLATKLKEYFGFDVDVFVDLDDDGMPYAEVSDFAGDMNPRMFKTLKLVTLFRKFNNQTDEFEMSLYWLYEQFTGDSNGFDFACVNFGASGEIVAFEIESDRVGH